MPELLLRACAKISDIRVTDDPYLADLEAQMNWLIISLILSVPVLVATIAFAVLEIRGA